MPGTPVTDGSLRRPDGGPLVCFRLLSFSYPKGNFGGNQLLDGSIGLSPLYPCPTNDLHVSTAAGLHQGFPWLHPAQA